MLKKKYKKSKYRKCIKNFIKYRDPDYDRVEYLVLDDRKMVLIVLSKVACTSIKVAIGKSYGIGRNFESGLDIHTQSGWHKEYGGNHPSYGDNFYAVFVRDPFSRLVSCYKDRILYSGEREGHQDYYFNNYPVELPANISFEEFVERVVEIPAYLADRHFKSQSYSIYRRSKKNHPDFIGKFETIQDDWSVLARKFGFRETLGQLNPSKPRNAVVESDYRKYYNAKTLALVHDKYSDDVELLGYKDAYLKLRQFVSDA